MHRFFFIMGGDSLDYFEQWKQPERIAKLATILVIPRIFYHRCTGEEDPFVAGTISL